MSTVPLEHIENEAAWRLPSKGVVAMASLITGESAIFTIFVVAYLYYIGRDVAGPTPKQVLEVPYFYSVCLLSSSFFIWLAEHAIEHGKMAAFRLWWSITVLLGLIFLYGTAVEWHKLITVDHLTVGTNLFGMMLLVTVFAFTRKLLPAHAERVKVLALYWHFVDAVWVVVFTVVYVVGR